MSKVKYFTVRAYAILIDNDFNILLSDEHAFGKPITKFPGGGVDPGEGTSDTLKREFEEELKQEIEIIEHFYTTDFFQQAFEYEKYQLISIYYFVKLKNGRQFKINEKAHNKPNFKAGDQTIRIVNLKNLSADLMSFPIDKHVADKLRKLFENNKIENKWLNESF